MSIIVLGIALIIASVLFAAWNATTVGWSPETMFERHAYATVIHFVGWVLLVIGGTVQLI